jgi:hypothetical protein
VSPFDAAGLIGVALILAAYAGAQLRWLDPLRPSALLMNLAGAALVLVSLVQRFNLAAFVMEASWALVALYGLLRLAFTRRRGRR